MTKCKYATAPAELYTQNANGEFVQISNPDRTLCAWATYHPEAVEKLTGTPPWLQRNALAGHLIRESDCDTCPLFERGPPVE